MPLDLLLPGHLTLALGPDLVLSIGAMGLLIWAALRPESAAHQRAVGYACIGVALATLAAVAWYAVRGYSATAGAIAVDNFRWGADAVILIGTILAIALAVDDNDRQGIAVAETHVLILLASSGMMLLVAARDLMIVFLGVELMSIASYALAGLNRRSMRSAEGALKYFLLGAFSTAFLLYGIALVYGATGATNLDEIGFRVASLQLADSPVLMIGVALMLVGFGFKVSTVPFHMWAPDVYEGAPTAVTAYMAATVKAAAFAAFLRVWLEAFPGAFESWHPAVTMLAIATMIFGNAIGLAQRNLKRLLAYSSIGHAGYLMVAIAAGTLQGASAMLFYLLAYTLATFGAFAVVAAVARTDSGVTLDELSGLWRVRPGLAIGMAVFMLALLGFPLFGGIGFLAKWYVLQAALQSPLPQTTLAVVLVLTSVIAAGYYLRVIRVMFMSPRAEGAVAVHATPALTRAVVGGAAIAIVVLGILPEMLVRATERGVPHLTARGVQVGRDPALPALVPVLGRLGEPGPAVR